MDERGAIALLKQGDISGLEYLVEKHQVRAVRAAYLVCRDTALAEDIVQSAFIRAFERIITFDDSLPFGPWFMRSVTNDALKAAARRERMVPLDVVPAENAAISPGLDERLESLETSAAINEAIAQLPPEQRAAIVMRYYLDMTDDEMSSRLEVARATVRWRLHAARHKLRGLLPGWLGPAGEQQGHGQAEPEAGHVGVAVYANRGDTI
jgi:RNA polymerase sigma-70 factor (ECF subfamily)